MFAAECDYHPSVKPRYPPPVTAVRLTQCVKQHEFITQFTRNLDRTPDGLQRTLRRYRHRRVQTCAGARETSRRRT